MCATPLSLIPPDFVCRRCGACCRIPDGFVRVDGGEIARIAAFLGIGEREFIESETEVAPDRKSLVLRSREDGACVYLTGDNRCRINPVKPEQCRTFPFEWTNADSASYCPGLGGRGAASSNGVATAAHPSNPPAVRLGADVKSSCGTSRNRQTPPGVTEVG